MFNWCQNVFFWFLYWFQIFKGQCGVLRPYLQLSSVFLPQFCSHSWKSFAFFWSSKLKSRGYQFLSSDKTAKTFLTSLTRDVTCWWEGWAIAHTGIGRIEGGLLLLANPALGSYLRPCLQNVQKLVNSCLSNESDTKPNYYDAPCIFVLLWFKLGLDGEYLVSVMLFTSVLIEICHQDGAFMVLYSRQVSISKSTTIVLMIQSRHQNQRLGWPLFCQYQNKS